MPYNDKTVRTTKGKVVYKRKSHRFTYDDIMRMLRYIQNNYPFDFNQKQFIINFLLESEVLDEIQETVWAWFINILSQVMPQWFIDLVNWVYLNIPAGMPPWYDDVMYNEWGD